MKKTINKPALAGQQGYILVTGLLFLVVLTLVGVTSINTSTLDYKISANTAFHVDAFENAESGLQSAGSGLLASYINDRSWSGFGVTIPAGVAVVDTNVDHFMGNGEVVGGDESTLIQGLYQDVAILNTDLTVGIDGDGDGVTGSSGHDVQSNIKLIKTYSELAAGNGAAATSGYEGLGKSSVGSLHSFYMIISAGQSAGNANAATATEFRYVE